jgi:hypothetical protein
MCGVPYVGSWLSGLLGGWFVGCLVGWLCELQLLIRLQVT